MPYDNTDKGVLFNNASKKQKESDPDYAGSVNVGGSEFWLSGWKKTSGKTGPYLSLAIRPKRQRQEA